ncbi:MAG: signal peptidase I, partial [Chloroflexota bacterium]|nr:signal peptidase I [Chloroflexota bacterium]
QALVNIKMEQQEQQLENIQTDSSPIPEDKTSSGWLSVIMDILETLLLSVVLFLGINAISARVRVEGSSMEPSFHDGEFVIVSRLDYRFIGSPDYGDVVVFHYPGNPDEEYIKRIIGQHGDHVRIADGSVYVNGHLLDEAYISDNPKYTGEWDVPAEHLFVLGDNRNNSSDSHSWGPLPIENVIGRAVFVYWPFSDWGVISPVNSINDPISQP